MPDTLYKILSAVKIEGFRILQDQKSFTDKISACFVKLSFHIYYLRICEMFVS